MARPRSFLLKVAVDCAKKAHGCQHAPVHRITTGTKRLRVKVGRSFEHYCPACAIKFLKADAERIHVIIAELEAI